MRWIVLLLLTGCVSQAEVDARRAYERDQLEAQRIARMESRCRAMGFQQGAPDFRQCMLHLQSGAMQQENTDRAIILQHLLNRR